VGGEASSVARSASKEPRVFRHQEPETKKVRAATEHHCSGVELAGFFHEKVHAEFAPIFESRSLRARAERFEARALPSAALSRSPTRDQKARRIGAGIPFGCDKVAVSDGSQS
jgi:hypothetical protein